MASYGSTSFCLFKLVFSSSCWFEEEKLGRTAGELSPSMPFSINGLAGIANSFGALLSKWLVIEFMAAAEFCSYRSVRRRRLVSLDLASVLAAGADWFLRVN